MENKNSGNESLFNLLIKTNEMVSCKIDKLFEEVAYLRHKLEGIDAGQIATLASRVSQLEDQGRDSESRVRHLELHQNRWFGSKTVIVGLATMIITAMISWGLRTIIPDTSFKDKAIPVLDKREEKENTKPDVLD